MLLEEWRSGSASVEKAFSSDVIIPTQ